MRHFHRNIQYRSGNCSINISNRRAQFPVRPVQSHTPKAGKAPKNSYFHDRAQGTRQLLPRFHQVLAFELDTFEFVDGIVGVLRQKFEFLICGHLDTPVRSVVVENHHRQVWARAEGTRATSTAPTIAVAILALLGRRSARRCHQHAQCREISRELNTRRTSGITDQGMQAPANKAIVGQPKAGVPQMLAPGWHRSKPRPPARLTQQRAKQSNRS
jgi:hypothetical protein